MKKPTTEQINIEMMKQMGVKMPETKKASKTKKKKITKHDDGDHEYR